MPKPTCLFLLLWWEGGVGPVKVTSCLPTCLFLLFGWWEGELELPPELLPALLIEHMLLFLKLLASIEL